MPRHRTGRGSRAVASLRRSAWAARRDLLHSLACWLELVALAQAGGMGIEGALEAASSLAGDPIFSPIRRALDRARHSGRSPWDGLGRLGGELGINELEELAASVRLAGTERRANPREPQRQVRLAATTSDDRCPGPSQRHDANDSSSPRSFSWSDSSCSSSTPPPPRSRACSSGAGESLSAGTQPPGRPVAPVRTNLPTTPGPTKGASSQCPRSSSSSSSSRPCATG